MSNYKNKSFVPYHFVGGTPALGQNKLIATTEGDTPRKCENCNNRCKVNNLIPIIGKPTAAISAMKSNMTDCLKTDARKAFKAGDNVFMPKQLHGQPVGNFCRFFEKDQTVSSTTSVDYISTNTEDQPQPPVVSLKSKDIQPEIKGEFVSTKNGKYYYPADYIFPKNIKRESLLYFANVEDAINSGKVPKF